MKTRSPSFKFEEKPQSKKVILSQTATVYIDVHVLEWMQLKLNTYKEVTSQ